MDWFFMKISDIQPSQLYINKRKLNEIRKWINVADLNYDPIPITKIGDNVIFTDGHTRAFLVNHMGEEKIKVYWDTDELPMDIYKKCVEWCLEEGVKHVRDLSEKIVEDSEYTNLWIKRCQQI